MRIEKFEFDNTRNSNTIYSPPTARIVVENSLLFSSFCGQTSSTKIAVDCIWSQWRPPLKVSAFASFTVNTEPIAAKAAT